ncbi:MAG: subclass B1 metallo-beta-lactamase [Bacteroidia bacterium]|nr:subclass B1 metallo-beta-lactamase [Bacteroidia bacterium]
MTLALSLISALASAGQSAAGRLDIAHLTGDFYVYTTYSSYEGRQLPANGLYLVTAAGTVLIDTPWDTTQFQPLLDSIQSRHSSRVGWCIATHWHSDRTEGLEYYRAQGIRTYTTVLTDELSRQHGKKRAEFLLARDSVFRIGPYSFETYYPGPGHTEDNLVIWFPEEQILYGGCLIKGADAENLGYLGDADVAAYERTLKRVRKRYPDPKFIIVSHSSWDDPRSLQHSIRLARQLGRRSRS